MFQHCDGSSTTKKVNLLTIHADPQSSKRSVPRKYEACNEDNCTMESINDGHWINRWQAPGASSPPSLCTTIDGSWSNNRSYSPSLASTLYNTNDIHFRTARTEIEYDGQIATPSSHIPKGDTARIQIAGFKNIHARDRTEHNGVLSADYVDPLNDDDGDDDDDDMTLLGEELNDGNTSSLGFTKQQPPVVADRRSLLTNMVLQCPPALSTSNNTRSFAHPSIILVDNDVLSSSLKQQVLWENRVNGVFKKSKNNSHDAADALDTFTGFW